MKKTLKIAIAILLLGITIITFVYKNNAKTESSQKQEENGNKVNEYFYKKNEQDWFMQRQEQESKKMQEFIDTGVFQKFTIEGYARYLIKHNIVNQYTTPSDFVIMPDYSSAPQFIITKKVYMPSTLGAGSYEFISIKEYVLVGREHRPNFFVWWHNYTDIVSKSHIPLYSIDFAKRLHIELKKLNCDSKILESLEKIINA
jgi:hypothetical protein